MMDIENSKIGINFRTRKISCHTIMDVYLEEQL